MTPIFHREIAILFRQKKYEKIKKTSEQIIPTLVFIAASLAIFASVNSKLLITTIAGEKFAAASFAATVMFLYPVHQTYGQLVSSLYYAAGQTKKFRNIAIINLLIGFVLSIVFLTPHDVGGLNLGSEGLALKMVIVQIFGVNLLLHGISKTIGLSFKSFLINQITICSLLSTTAFTSKYLVAYYSIQNNLLEILSLVIVYAILTVILTIIFHYFRLPVFLDDNVIENTKKLFLKKREN
jgi:O-antigen/teichoic acid export membrane protein